MRELTYQGKNKKQQQEDELDNVRAKIDICKYKQDEAIRETKDIEKELAAERHKYRRVEEELQRQLEKQLRKKETSRIVHQTYEYQIKRLQAEISLKEKEKEAMAQD